MLIGRKFRGLIIRTNYSKTGLGLLRCRRWRTRQTSSRRSSMRCSRYWTRGPAACRRRPRRVPSIGAGSAAWPGPSAFRTAPCAPACGNCKRACPPRHGGGRAQASHRARPGTVARSRPQARAPRPRRPPSAAAPDLQQLGTRAAEGRPRDERADREPAAARAGLQPASEPQDLARPAASGPGHSVPSHHRQGAGISRDGASPWSRSTPSVRNWRDATATADAIGGRRGSPRKSTRMTSRTRNWARRYRLESTTWPRRRLGQRGHGP